MADAELEAARARIAELERALERCRGAAVGPDGEVDAQDRIRWFEVFHRAAWGVVVASGDGTTSELMNPAFAAMHGYTVEELSALPVVEQFAPECRADVADNVRLANEKGHHIWESRHLRKDGSTFPVLLDVTVVRDASDRVVWRIVYAQDLSERERAEEHLRESREFYQDIFEKCRTVKLLIDPESGRVVEANGVACEFYGYTREALTALHLWDLNMLDEDVARQRLAAAVRAQHTEFDVGHRLASGEVRDVRVYSSLVKTGGRPLLHAIIIDVTERRRVEAALVETERRLSAVVGSSPIGIVVSRAEDGRLLDVNDAALRLYGYTRDEVVGRTVGELGTWAKPEQRAEMLRLLAEHGVVHQFPVEFRRRGGEVGVLEVSGCLLELHGTRCLLTMLVDVTARARAEGEKAQLEGQLRQAQKMESVGRLAGGVAHDFNNMLAVILSHAEMALDDAAGAQPVSADLEGIRGAAQRSADLTRQLLAFARKQAIAPAVLDLNEVVHALLKMLQRVIGEDVGLRWVPEEGLWPVSVDRSQLDQVVANLCVNARDAIADVGTVTIETGNVTLDEGYCAAHVGCTPGDYVQLSISDDGCGMSEEVRGHVFEPFFTTKEQGKGTGLGLATAYGIVKQNGGYIDVRSEVGKGTTFTLYLPRHEGVVESRVSIVQGSQAPRGRETVLLVEDELAILRVTARMLEGLGYDVLAASSPVEAIRLAEQSDREIALLLTDVVMPGMNGRDLGERLAAVRPGLRRVFMSGFTADVIANHGVLHEGVHFVQKPFTKRALADKLREVLDAPAERAAVGLGVRDG